MREESLGSVDIGFQLRIISQVHTTTISYNPQVVSKLYRSDSDATTLDFRDQREVVYRKS